MRGDPRKFLTSFLIASFLSYLIAFYPTIAFGIEEGSLLITSKPPGAAIYLDNNKIANTDTMFDKIPVGTYEITVELPGYKKSKSKVEIKAGLTKTVHFELQPLAAAVEPKPQPPVPPVAKPTKKEEKQQKAQEPAKLALPKPEPQKKEPEKTGPPTQLQPKPEDVVSPPVEIAKPSNELEPPSPVPPPPPKVLPPTPTPTPLPRKPFLEMIDPWFILLIILVLIGVILLTLVLKFISRRKKPSYEVKAAHAVKAETPARPLRIKTPIGGVSLKDAPVIGEYRIIGKIASGGMANIYKATHVRKGGIVALKVPYEQFQNDKNFIERFRREAELGKKLHNENIIRIHESETTEDGFTYIAMEYLDGMDLRQYLDRHGKMSICEAIKTTVSVCRALDYAHVKGIIHRDIKPENIMLPNKKEKGKVVLMDFGVAHAAYLGTLGTKSTYLGTPYYMSPDQLSGKEVDARSDIYSLGVVFFEMLTGQRPFNEADPLKVLIQHRETLPPKPSSLDPEIPAVLDSMVLKMLAKKPENRYQNIEGLINALQEYMLREGINID